MKMFKADLYEVFDENGNLVGEQILGSTLGKKEHLKVDGEIYYHKGIGFFGRETHYNNKAGRLMLKIDSVHQRIFYYGEKYTEIYYFKSKSWYNSSISLYQFENDQLLVKFRRRYNFLKPIYEVQVEENFHNKLVNFSICILLYQRLRRCIKNNNLNMKKLGIIGCGWLGNHIAERLSNQYQIFATTTTESKVEEFQSKGYQTTLVNFLNELDVEMKEWEAAKELDAIIISVPFSGIRGTQIPMNDKRENLLNFLGDFKGQLFLASSTGVYSETEKEFTEDDQPTKNVESESFILDKFPQTNILRLAGLMGGQRLLKNYNISNLDQLVNHIHYADICSVIEKMLDNQSESKVYNVVAPIHPNKEEVINAQKDLPYNGERTTIGRTISPEKLIKELDFEFQYPDPRYFHK